MMSYIDLVTCWEELGGVGKVELILFPVSPSAQVLLFAPLFLSILSVILAPTPLLTPQVSDAETWGSGYSLLHNRSPQDVVT